MKTRFLVISMVVSLVSVFASVAHGAEKKAHKSTHKDQPTITYIDASTPDAPSSEFPTIANKGKL